MSTRQAAELDHAFERNGWTPAEVKKLSQGDMLATVRRVLLGDVEIITPEHIIDCDAKPHVPDGWSILSDDGQLPNRVRGAFKWDKESQKNALHRDKGQKNGKRIKGYKLRKGLANKPVLNANVLDYLIAKPHLIPEEWKGKAVFFWGTIYRNRDGRLYVRYLLWVGDRWHWYANWLGYDWRDDCPAAVGAR
tara:strand:+ start:315 stop:890 length:576 start_codon:yes stop_codon:yes gene_type:complete